MTPITKAVFPVAGMGTRFLPATKASPKEMLPIVDKPLIQYAVEEAAAAGITQMIFVTGRNKRAIEDHFDKNYELEAELEARGKDKLLEEVRQVIPSGISCIYIRQADTLGLGHAILCARPAVGREPFAVLLADDLIDANPPVLRQMLEVYEEKRCSMLGVQEVAPQETGQYGIVKIDGDGEGVRRVIDIVEKPRPSEAPSTLGVVGRYILTPRIFDHLERLTPGAGGELQLTDGIAALAKEEPVMAFEFSGTRYDCGSKLGYLKAMVAYGLKHAEVGQEFGNYLAGLGRSLAGARAQRSSARP
ncbi:UTP--glucose-1-phosphate uridylyltransferase GalU [Pelomicrobium methylotrophicum]|uniref:UTP--glucose-1-phosphate uridylyltransferase n=1 Tax=Pelomicrobium methylotrophicum TaxID=2602750 RepID=A0A5C7F1M0_9PROT|nr:UTP--glucose-1-phosphate uridylyltransferase GalU [Pelomicrobium methylotrophicum]TXF13678.1 UTP--glucose-1-phosphate uridylyltransferase GalU [Pelomicrobium methylotrophicum]